MIDNLVNLMARQVRYDSRPRASPTEIYMAHA